ncbi:MAG TPA: hypothetical protein VID95_10210 [Candidatus Limnocylindrales bacterium]|jgi:hypothetical protein
MTSSALPRPVLVLNPPDDRDFTSLARRLVSEGVRTPDELEQRLHERHPSAVVRPRELAGEPAETWYVYRDGRWVPSAN